MNQAGGLKKRRKRQCIAKVTGLGQVAYDEANDTFTGREMYEPNLASFTKKSLLKSKPFGEITRGPHDTRIRIGLSSSRLNSSSRVGGVGGGGIRITRNPEFNIQMDQDEFDKEETAVVSNFDFEDENCRPDPNHKRPYLLNERTMARLRQLLILGMTSGAFPWMWNPKKVQIEKFPPKWEKWWYRIWAVTTIQTVFLTGFQVYTFFYRLNSGTYRELFTWSFSFVWYSCAVVFGLNMYLYKDYIRQYINSLLFMNKKFVDRYVLNADEYDDSGKILINVSIVTNITQVFISVSLFLRVPYKPWFLYSYIYHPDNPWYWLIPGALQEFMVVGQVITSYMLLGWIIVAHTNSVNFWLRESHNNNDTVFTRKDARDPNHAMRTYKALQIVCQIFNDCMSPISTPMVKIHVWICIVPTGYVLIRSMNHIFIDEFPGILTYPFAIIDCVTGGFAILAVGAEMYDLGVSFIESWSRTRQKDFRRILMSCPTLKVKVGHFYPITISTTITFFKSVLDYITDCIITF